MIRTLETRYGKMMVPDTDRGQYWWLANTGASPEDVFIDMICQLLDERPKGCAVDVGANFGCWTLPLAKHAHSVVAIEPQPGVFALLDESCAMNGLTNVMRLRLAAGDSDGKIDIPLLDAEHDANFGGVSLAIPHHEQPDAPMVSVRIARLDDLVQGERTSFIKVDVEGFEAKVIAGAEDLIRRCKPVLFVEMDHKLTNSESLRATIEAFGYMVEVQGGNFLGVPA